MNSVPRAVESPSAPPKPGMAKKWLVAILVLTFAFVLMPFLLWYMTTFTRPLNDADLASYFADALHPRRAQHALSQIADRIMSPNPGIRASAKIWYPEVIQFSEQGSDELRVTAAWVMGQDNQSPQFHAALAKQLADANPMVQRNAALSLVRFADPSGHALIAGMLTPYTVVAQRTGNLSIRLKPGDGNDRLFRMIEVWIAPEWRSRGPSRIQKARELGIGYGVGTDAELVEIRFVRRALVLLAVTTERSDVHALT